MKKVLQWIDKNMELAFSSVCLVLMVLSVTIQVLSRYVLHSSIPWTEEATRFLFIWMVFPAIGICAKEGKHIRITLLPSALPPKAAKVVDIFSDVKFRSLFKPTKVVSLLSGRNNKKIPRSFHFS